MITLKLREIVDASEALGELLGLGLTGKAGWDAGKLAKRCRSELADFQEQNMALLQKYGSAETRIDANGEPFQTGAYVFSSPDNRAAYNAEMKQLLDIDINLDCNRIPFEVVDERIQRVQQLAEEGKDPTSKPPLRIYSFVDWAIEPPF